MNAVAAPISPARRVAFEALRRTFENHAWTDRALGAAAERTGLDARDRAQAQRLAYGAVQRRGTSDHLIERLARRPVNRLDAPVLAALRLGVYELLFSERVPDYAAVDQAVALARDGMAAGGAPAGKARAAAGLANAVLRRAAKLGPGFRSGLDDSTPEAAAVKHSYPVWLARMWWEELGGADAVTLMAAMNEPSETAFRVNTLRADPASLAEELRRAGETVEGPRDGSDPLWPTEAIVVRGRVGGALQAAITSGGVFPQSRGSQAVVGILNPRPGERVLDLCAGPGIKTTAIAARLGGAGELVAVEKDPGRARQLRELCARAGAGNVRVEVADATEADLGEDYDRVLVDPPCSDLGTLASRPDARWRKSPELIDRLAGLQARLLERAAEALAPGGSLVYATCTISRRENEDLVRSAVELAPGLAVADLGSANRSLAPSRDPRFVQLRPDRDRTSGFFIATLAGAA
jgi:16S rRNA (cytosine967-C5)-methyltransferase